LAALKRDLPIYEYIVAILARFSAA